MATATSTSLPRSIHQGLRRVGRRIRWLSAVKGLGLLAVVLAVGAAGGMALDFGWALPGWLRWGIWLAWVGVGVAVLGKGVVGPLVKRWSWADLAALAEAGQPDLAERLVSAVELAGAGAEGHGSLELIGALVGETEERARGLDLARAVEDRGAGWWFGGGVLVLAVVIGPMVVWPDPLATLGKRFLMPWSGVGRVDRFLVTVEPGDAVAAVGSDVEFRATVRPRFGGGRAPRSAWLEWNDAGGHSQRAAMAAEAGESSARGEFTYTLKGLPGTIDYRVVSGPASSQTRRIRAIEPPTIAKISARVESPSYTKISPFEASDPNRLNVWEGSRVTLSIEASKPLERAIVQWPTVSADGGRKSSRTPLKPLEDRRTWSATVSAEISGTFTFSLQDREGLASRPEMPRRVRVVVDEPPTVALGGTGGFLESKPDDILLIDVTAGDDVAVASATLHYTITRADSEKPETGTTTAPLVGLGTRTAAGQAVLALKSLNLNADDEVAYFVEVADNRPPPRGPNRARTESRRLRIAERAPPLLEQQGQAERATIRGKLVGLQRAVNENQQATARLRHVADAALQGNGQWSDERTKALSEREGEARAIVEGFAELARDFRDAGRFAPLARPARQIAEIEAEGARAMLEQAGRTDDPSRRLEDLRQADARHAALKERIEALVRQFDEEARQEDDRRRLGLLAERQDELAQRIANLAHEGANADAIERGRQEQEALRREVDELARRSPELRDDILTQQLREAESLADRAGELAESQREEARQIHESPERTDALADLARRQRGIEADARRLAMEVNAALKENGRGELDTEALARPVEPLQRGETEQARQRIDEAETLLRRLGRDLDEVRRDPKALARRLAHRQRELQDQANQAIREARTPEARAALPESLRALAGRQAAIGRLVEAIPADESQKDLARQALEATRRAADTLGEGHAESTPSRLNEARAAIEALAGALPDPNQRRNQVRQNLNQIRDMIDQNGRELARHLRETTPKTDSIASARGLARRVEPLMARQEEIIAKLDALDIGPESRAQRDRARQRASTLADALRGFHEAWPAEPPDAEEEPSNIAADWRLIGPFVKNMPPPFEVGGPVNLKAVLKDKTNRAAVWKSVHAEDDLIDLNRVYPGAGRDVSAYGLTEIPSPLAGPGRLTVGSDDTLMAWLNGEKVYDFQGHRSHDPKQDEVAVTFTQGVNLLVVRCGNGDGDWKFSVAVTPPPTGEQARRLTLAEQFREHLPLVQADARVSIDRLRESLDGRVPADDLAAELATELEALGDGISSRENPPAKPGNPEIEPPTTADEARRIATALRSLNVPDAPASQAEAVRLADRAARLLKPADVVSGVERDPSRALDEAARAARTLADRLAGSQSPTERVESIARAQRGQNEPDAPHDSGTAARLQRALADDLARLAPDPSESRRRAETAIRDAVALAVPAAREPRPEALASARERAAEAIETLAETISDQPGMTPTDRQDQEARANSEPNKAPEDPELAIQPEHVEIAQALARRERHLGQDLQARLADRVKPQEDLRDEAEALGRDLARLRDETQALSPRSRGHASRAAELLGNQAATAMTRAADQLAQGRSDPARALQRQAADHAEQAARAVGDLIAALRGDLSAEARQAAESGAGEGPPSLDGLVGARRSQDQAASQLADALAPESSPERSSPATEAAAASMRAAAQGLRTAAAPGPHSRERSPADPARARLDPRGGPGGPAPLRLGAIPGEPTADPRDGRIWGELPGYLRDEILQSSQSRYRDDYARLIQLYFREIAGASGSPISDP